MKKFSTRRPKQGDPIPFELEVIRYEDVKVVPDDGGPVLVERQEVTATEAFEAHPDVSGGNLVQLELMGKPGRRNGRGADALYDFFDAALLPDDARRFRELIESPDVFVDVETITDVAMWLYQVYAGREERPTTRT